MTKGEEEIARRLFDALRPIIADIVQDEIVGEYHPEFGSAWMEPDGSLFKLFRACEQEAFERGRDSVLKARELKRKMPGR